MNPSQTSEAPVRPGTAAPLNIQGFDRLKGNAKQYGMPGDVPTIRAEGNLPFTDIADKLMDLVRLMWTAATASQNAPRSGVQIGGGARQAHIPNGVAQLQGNWKPEAIFEAQRMKERNAAYVPQARPTGGTLPSPTPAFNGVARDWKAMEALEQINAYTFRGDTRPPTAIEAAGGFFPPNTRTDQHYLDNVIYPQFRDYMIRRFNVAVSKDVFVRAYKKEVVFPHDSMVMRNFFLWRSFAESEAYHAGRMIATEALKGYISTSRSTAKALAFTKSSGWLYVTLVRGGFVVPAKGASEWTKFYDEQEIALPGPVEWKDVIGFRQTAQRNMIGPLYLRSGFAARNPEAYEKVFTMMGGVA